MIFIYCTFTIFTIFQITNQHHHSQLTSFLLFFLVNEFSQRTIQAPKDNMMMAWPASPNMTANKKGKVMIVYGAGLTSR